MRLKTAPGREVERAGRGALKVRGECGLYNSGARLATVFYTASMAAALPPQEAAAAQCFRSFHTDERTQEGVEALRMMGKGQVKRLGVRDSSRQSKFVESLFGVPAQLGDRSRSRAP